jgi:CubicO group peptidase (beta-lactamase class C family)
VKNTILTTIIFQFVFVGFTFATPGEVSFHAKLEEIQAEYKIPSMAVRVTQINNSSIGSIDFDYYSGLLNNSDNSQITTETMFPIASLTKVFSGNLVLKLVNQGKLSLSDSVSDIVPESALPAEITIAHLLSHTLLGAYKNHFFYDQRFAYLGAIVSKVTNRPFKDVLLENIQQDFLANNIIAYTTDAIKDKTLALGHAFDGNNKAIGHDYGISASAGLVSNADSLIDVGNQLMHQWHNEKLAPKSVFKRHGMNPRYGNGLFLQIIEGIEVYWGYGQYDGYASLWIMVPEKKLQLVMFANNNVLSDASRLIFGDVTASPVYIAFAQAFLCENTPCVSAKMQARANLLKQTYFSRYTETAYKEAVGAINSEFPQQQNWIKKGDLHLLHASSYLHTVAHHLEYTPPDWSKYEEVLLLEKLKANKNNPYWLYYLGSYYIRQGEIKSASRTFLTLLSIPDMPSSHWTNVEAQQWLVEQENAKVK